MKTGISFCIITNGYRIRKLNSLLKSIESLEIPNYEVIISGELRQLPKFSSMNIVYCMNKHAAEKGLLSKLRNDAAKKAIYDTLIVVDDDVIFAKDFYIVLKNIIETTKFDVLCTRFLNPDGTRYWDWVIENESDKRLIKYEESHPDIYITGGRCILKKYVFLKVCWNEKLGFYEKEDVDFSSRIKNAGFSISINPKLKIIHNDWSYTQRKDMVRRYGIVKVLFRNIYRFFGLVNEKF